MVIPCKDIALILHEHLLTRVDALRKIGVTPKLVTFLIGSAPEQISFVEIKRRLATSLGVEFELKHFKDAPREKQLIDDIKYTSNLDSTTGIIIQQPVPVNLDLKKLYEHIPKYKEIEGHRTNSEFNFPLTLAVLAGIKYIILAGSPDYVPDEKSIVDFESDSHLLFNFLMSKKIVIAGRGPTGGAPIKKVLNHIGVNVIQTDSKTQDSNKYYKEADIIITATGKNIINKENIKQDVILLNVGLRKEEGKLRGDYLEDEISDKASFYTITPRGLGPLDVLYLYKNLIDAAYLKAGI